MPALRDELEQQGRFLFRWRSYLPLLLLIPFFIAAGHFAFPWDSHFWDSCWDLGVLLMALMGSAVRLLVVGYAASGTSGRNTTHQRAGVLNTTGMYACCRHPLYLANMTIYLAIAAFWRDPLVVMLTLSIGWVYYERIIAHEEAFLTRSFGAQFSEWAAHTPCILPRLWRWQSPAHAFDWRRALRREYGSLAAVLLLVPALDFTVDSLLVFNQPHFEPQWIAIFAAGLVFYAAVRMLVKSGRLKDADEFASRHS